MAVSVGGVSIDILRGTVPELKDLVEIWKRPGLDGVGARNIGTGGGGFSMVGIYFASSAADAESKLNALGDKQGTVVSIEDAQGTTHANCLLVGLGRHNMNKVIQAGGEKVLLTVPMSFQRTGA